MDIQEFDFEEFSGLFHSAVDEMYPMDKGALIIDPNKGMRIGDGEITRKQMKHIVEQRKAEGRSLQEITGIVDYIPCVIIDFDFEIRNHNGKYPGSVIRYKVFQEWEQGIAVVMDEQSKNTRKVITAYLCSPAKIYKIREKLNASAAGETPHS